MRNPSSVPERITILELELERAIKSLEDQKKSLDEAFKKIRFAEKLFYIGIGTIAAGNWTFFSYIVKLLKTSGV